MIGRTLALAVLVAFSSVDSLLTARAAEPQLITEGVIEESFGGENVGETTSNQKPAARTKGYTCVFMGHSFFYRVANDFDQVAIGSGFPDHKQVVRVAHGIEGTPGWLWDHVGPKEEARRMLKEEQVDLLAISYHHRSADRCGVEDYSRWIDFAREKNPDIMIAIGISWTGLPTLDITPEQYSAIYPWVAAPIYKLIDQLREKYLRNVIFAIPHGKGVFALYAGYKAGQIPELKTLLPRGKDSKSALFLDTRYHAGPMALAVTRLIFLATIYETDPRESTWKSGFQADLKQIAYQAVQEEPYAQLVKGKQFSPPPVVPRRKQE